MNLKPIVHLGVAILASLALSLPIARAKTSSYHLDEVYPIDAQGTLYLRTGDADIQISGSDRKDVHLVVHYTQDVHGLGVVSDDEPFAIDVTPEHGDLRIREQSGSRSYIGVMVSVREEYTITIEAPSTVKLQLVGDDGSYSINSFSSAIGLRMDDGRARLRKLTGTEYDFEMGDGSIDMEGGSGRLEVSMDDGRFSGDSGAFSSVDAEMEDGTMELESTLSDSGEYRLRADDGSIRFTILGGGGTFTVDYDDGHVRSSGAFQMMDSDEGYRLFNLPGGTAHSRIRIADGTVSLRAK